MRAEIILTLFVAGPIVQMIFVNAGNGLFVSSCDLDSRRRWNGSESAVPSGDSFGEASGEYVDARLGTGDMRPDSCSAAWMFSAVGFPTKSICTVVPNRLENDTNYS